jgi:hypothetical protein
MRKERASKVAEMLCDHTTWRTHGRSLKIEDLRDVLIIERIDEDPKIADTVYRIKTVIRLIFDGSTVYKLFFLDDLKISKTFSINPGGNPPISNPFPPSKGQKKSVDSVELDIQCPKCGVRHKVNGYLDVDSQAVKIAKLPTNPNLKENNTLVCNNCNLAIDLNPIKNQVESQTKRKVIFQ